MPQFDVIVIGGGLSGLSAGAFLSRQGLKILLLEQHYIPGGCATTFKRKDIVMEAGLHAMDGHLVNPENQRSLLKHLGIRKQVKFIPVPEFFHIEGKGIDFTFPCGESEAREALIRAYPGEEKGIRKFMDTIMGVQSELSSMPKSLWGKLIKYPRFPFLYPNIFGTFRLTVGRFLDRHISDPELKLILQGNMLYYHDDPCTMSMIFFAKAQASFIKYGAYFIRGGSQKLSDALAELIRENGGQVLLGTMAEHILIRDGRAAGVEVRDSFNSAGPSAQYTATNVIHSGSLPLLPGLLPRKEALKIEGRIRKLKPTTSLLTLYLGFDRDITHLTKGQYSSFYFDEEIRDLCDVKENMHGDWDKRSFVFVNYGVIDSGLCAEGKGFGALCTADLLADYAALDDDQYRKKKEEIARILMQRLEEKIPGIGECITHYELGTSRTIRRYTLNPAGAPYGYAQIPGQIGFSRPSSSSPVKHLWLAGTWTFPGGGFTGALLSGFLCGYKLMKTLDDEVSPSPGPEIKDPRKVRVRECREIDTSTLEITTDKPEFLSFRPGQYAVLALEGRPEMHLDMPHRPLSILSHPDDPFLRFAMRKSSSPFKKACYQLKKGDLVTVFGPMGSFTLDKTGNPLVFLASGIGITPVVPMLKELEKQAFPAEVVLLHSNRGRESMGYAPDLEKIRLPAFTCIQVDTLHERRIDKERLSSILPEQAGAKVYIVGRNSFVNSMKEYLAELEIAESSIVVDDFG